MNIANKTVNIKVPVPANNVAPNNPFKFVETDYQNKVLAELIQSFAVGDVCLVGKNNVYLLVVNIYY